MKTQVFPEQNERKKSHMTKEVINEKIALEIPEGFQVMSADDLYKLYQENNFDRWGIWNRDRHIVITVSWQRVPALLSVLADVKSIAKRNQQLAAKGYAGHNYREEGLFSAEAENVHLEGYRFSYDLQNFRQKAETLLMKYEKMIYNFTCVSREESAAEGSELFRNLIAGMKLD